MYVIHPDYADSPETFVRAFLLIQNDINELFNYIEPSDQNLKTHSHRIHELLLRTCVEVEANCKAILRENGYIKQSNWTVDDYRKIEQSHFISRYEVKIPTWQGQQSIRKPFNSWATSTPSLTWYQAYNKTKHDRHINFADANFENLMTSACALAALMAAQFLDHDFSPGPMTLSINPGGPTDGFKPGIGGFFRIKYPDINAIPSTEQYDFQHKDIDFNADIFQKFTHT